MASIRPVTRATAPPRLQRHHRATTADTSSVVAVAAAAAAAVAVAGGTADAKSVEATTAVIVIASEDKFKAVLAKTPYCLIDFHAAWCGPCKAIAPRVEEMASAYGTWCTFGKIDVDHPGVAELATETHRVRNLPTFVLFRRGQEVDRLVGADLAKLRDMVNRHVQRVQDSS